MNVESAWRGRKAPDEIQADIERTRADVGRALDEIKERLSPGNLKRRVREAAREKAREVLTTARVRTREWSAAAAERVRERPLSLILAGAAVGGGIAVARLLLRRRREGQQRQVGFPLST